MSKEIDNFLDNYIKDTIYDYAVMIDGEWGSGKTFYIKNYVERKGREENFIYVSLYGIKDTEDISNIIFSQIIRQMNLYKIVDEKVSEGRLRKVGNVGGKLLSDFLKNKGLDFKEIKKASVEAIGFSKYKFIFDDLERCSCDINEVLGYINNLVEHNGVKVILIANESEIKNIAYGKIKEKLVANTIKYKPNLKELFLLIIDRCIENIEVNKVLKENINIFLNSPNHNIRTFQFFLSKFNKVYDMVSFINKSNYKNKIFQAYIKEFYSECNLYKSNNNGKFSNNDINSFKFIRQYISTDFIDEKEVVENINDYITFYEKSVKNSNLDKLKSWYILSELEVKEVIEEILKDIKSGKDDSSQFGEIIRILIILNHIGFEEQYINRAKDAMKKSISANDKTIEIFLFEDTFSSNSEENKVMEEKFTLIINEINDVFYNRDNNVYKDQAMGIIKSDKFIEEINGLNYNKRNDKLRNIFINFDIDLLVSRMESLNNKEFCDFRMFFSLIDFKKEDIEFLKYFSVQIEKVELSSFDLIKVKNWNMLKNNVKFKISRL